MSDFRRENFEGLRDFLNVVYWDSELECKLVDAVMEHIAEKCREAVEPFIPRRC